MSEVRQYRKKPVVIEAMQYSTSDDYYDICDWVGGFGGKYTKQYRFYGDMSFGIQTLEGNMSVSVGDWVIKGVKGEFYPCKPDIFEQTYDEVTE